MIREKALLRVAALTGGAALKPFASIASATRSNFRDRGCDTIAAECWGSNSNRMDADWLKWGSGLIAFLIAKAIVLSSLWRPRNV
ncbi:MAG: hypothetical protein C0524_18970 [Rhodobacter sp.]|nr:hypothetical protein [Rhodobacter sp.]